ncbi:GTP-binding protein GEM [Folsomia candida]|nr:GTP-binding protein GEM [Folsomia candida]
MAKKKPSPLKINPEDEQLLSDNTSATSSRRSSAGGGLAYLASRRNSLSPKLLQKCELEKRQKKSTSQRRQSNFLELPVLEFGKNSPRKHRVGSLPARSYHGNHPHHHHGDSSDTDDEDDSEINVDATALMYRLRNFNIKDNRVVNEGDEVLPRNSRRFIKSNPSTRNSSRNSPISSSCCNSNNSMESIYSEISDTTSGDFFFGSEENRYRVVMLGHSGVGKSALVNQFMTSEYISTYDASLDDEFGERTISVQLDGQESELVFIDHPCSEMSPENSLATYNPHCCIIVYSITDRHSYAVAEEILRYLWQVETSSKAVILVGNKCDLERAREVQVHEGKTLATTYSAKFIETSPGLQHNVDELLVGSLKQCRLRHSFHDNQRRKQRKSLKHKRKRNIFSIHELAWELLRKLVQAEDLLIKKSKSCQNLHVL